jgi:predicted ATP-dependent endonuclease of OLD family
MRISSLSITNFRSIEDITLPLPQLCTLVGPNNGGKSNILEALRRVLGTGWVSVSSFAAEDVFMHDSGRDLTISCSIEPPIQFHKFKNAPPPRFMRFLLNTRATRSGRKRASLV